MAKSKIGRPIKLTDEVIQKLREGFLKGYTDSQACLYANIGTSTFYDYCQKNVSFSEQKEQWKKNPILKAKDTIFDNLGDVKIAQWYLEKKCSDEFTTSVKQQIQVAEVPIINDDI